MTRPIYLDNLSTTPVDQRVVDVMIPFMTEFFGNAGSGHIYGREVDSAVRAARLEVAKLIGACSSEIFFTSGATESNNTAIKGIATGLAKIGKHIITSKTEHKAVLEACHSLEPLGFEITYLPVDRHGMVQAADVKKAIRTGKLGTTDQTILVSIMGANNEIGTINPIQEIGKICEEADVIFHVDAAQYAGKVEVDVHALGIDLLSMSGHKMYGPKGIGALFVAKCNNKINLAPLMSGGGQESGIRSGTLPVQLIVAMGKACELARTELEANIQKTKMLRDRLYIQIKTNLTGVSLNGHPETRLPGTLSVSFDGVDGEILMLRLKDIAVSTGSACSKMASHVLAAIGLDCDLARSTLRFGIGKQNTIEEIDYTAKKVIEHVKVLRNCCAKETSAPKNTTETKASVNLKMNSEPVQEKMAAGPTVVNPARRR